MCIAPPLIDSRRRRQAHFVRNHAGAILASDFLVTISAKFRTLSFCAVLDVVTRRIGNLTRTGVSEFGPSVVRQPARCVPALKAERFP